MLPIGVNVATSTFLAGIGVPAGNVGLTIGASEGVVTLLLGDCNSLCADAADNGDRLDVFLFAGIADCLIIDDKLPVALFVI